MKKSAVFAFLFLGVLWGSNFILMKSAAEVVTPAQVTLLRVLCGFVPVLVCALARGALSWSHLRHIHHFFVMSVLATTIDYFAYAQGTALLPSGIAGALSGTIPIFAVLCAWLLQGKEGIDGWKGAGIVLGFFGVVLIAQPWHNRIGDIDPAGVAWILAGSVSMGLSFIYARRFVTPLGIPGVALTTYQVGLAAIYLFPFAGLRGTEALLLHPAAATGLILGLGLLGTGVAYLAYYHIVEHLGGLAASSVTYIPPVVALAIGVLFVGEPITASLFGAVSLILAGVALTQAGPAVQRAFGISTGWRRDRS